MEKKEKDKLEDLRQELLEEKTLATILSDHFNVELDKNGQPNEIEIHRYFSEYAILNSMLSKHLEETIKNLDKVLYEEKTTESKTQIKATNEA